MQSERVIDKRKLWTESKTPTVPRILTRKQENSKTISLKSLFPTVPNPKYQKLITHDIKFNSSIKNLNPQPGSFVIGVLGKEGVGKSTIMEYLNTNPIKRTLDTAGIELHITSDGLLLLDSQRIISAPPSKVLHNAPDDDPRYGDLVSLKTCLFVLSVCHVIIVVGDDQDDDPAQLYRYLSRVMAMQKSFKIKGGKQSSKNSKSGIVGRLDLLQPQPIFIVNKCDLDNFSKENAKKYQNLIGNLMSGFTISCPIGPQPFLEAKQPHSLFGDLSKINNQLSFSRAPLLENKQNLTNCDQLHWNETVDLPTVHLLPITKLFRKETEKSVEEMARDLRLPARFSTAIRSLCNRIKGMPRLLTQGTNKSPFAISEKDWLRMAEKVWNFVDDLDYEDLEKLNS